MPTYLSRCSGTVNEMVMFSYLAFKVMGFSNMKTYRQREKQGTKVSDSNKGPDEAKIKVSPH